MTKDLRKAIGGVLRAKREKLGISQEEVAERAGVDRTYVSILERGLKSPTLETFERICCALRTLPERVIERARRKSDG
jgi:transcriptional regulator with XRE-family HTH domain